MIAAARFFAVKNSYKKGFQIDIDTYTVTCVHHDLRFLEKQLTLITHSEKGGVRHEKWSSLTRVLDFRRQDKQLSFLQGCCLFLQV
tara:strand:- start:7109 stop:7366 length:258 start_codon:yes stop_codon:yes gene_type:complete